MNPGVAQGIERGAMCLHHDGAIYRAAMMCRWSAHSAYLKAKLEAGDHVRLGKKVNA
jgi:hypothetical protein